MQQECNFDVILSYVRRNTIEQERGHVVKRCLSGAEVNRSEFFVTSKARPLHWHMLVFMARTRSCIPRDHILVRVCEVKACLSHWISVPKKFNPVSSMEADELALARWRFVQHCEDGPNEHGCINWKGRIAPVTGYGMSSLGGRNMHAHDLAWMLENRKEIPKGLIIRHMCVPDNKLCVNPQHLQLGTHKENAQDQKDRGLVRAAEDSPTASISNAVALQIIASFGNGKTQAERAREFGVSRDIVQHIDRAENWVALMTPEQIEQRRSVRRHRQNVPISLLRIKQEMARGEVLDEATQANYRKQLSEYFGSVRERMQKRSKKFVDEQGSEHWLWNNDASQQDDKPRYRTSWFGADECVSRVSQMAHTQKLSIPAGVHVRHACRYKHCVKPDHLSEGTPQQNSDDKIRDGTTRRGELNPKAKMTNETARQIKLSRGLATLRARASVFGVSMNQISGIDSGKSWNYIKSTGALDEATLEKLRQVQESLNAQNAQNAHLGRKRQRESQTLLDTSDDDYSTTQSNKHE